MVLLVTDRAYTTYLSLEELFHISDLKYRKNE